MPTRVKRIYQVFNGPASGYNTTYTVTDLPSTSGDIVTRVLIDNIWWYASDASPGSGQTWFRIYLDGFKVARLETSTGALNGEVIITGGSHVVNAVAASGTAGISGGGGAPFNFQGSGLISNYASISINWHFPTQFYASPGQQITIDACTPPGTNRIKVSFICIGEY